MRQTTFVKKESTEADWYIVDASDQVLGRLAAKLAVILQGKHKPGYTPHVDCGDFVIVTHASQLRMTGSKGEQRFSQSYSGYPGGLKQVKYSDLLRNKPDRLLTLAVRRMLPKTTLGRQMLKKLKIYAGEEHPHQAQQPKTMSIDELARKA